MDKHLKTLKKEPHPKYCIRYIACKHKPAPPATPRGSGKVIKVNKLAYKGQISIQGTELVAVIDTISKEILKILQCTADLESSMDETMDALEGDR